VGQLVWEVLWSDEAEAEGALQAGDCLRRVTAFGAGGDVGRGGGSEAQSAVWAANVDHGRVTVGSSRGGRARIPGIRGPSRDHLPARR